MIYNRTRDEHLAHTYKVFLTFYDDKLYANLKKYSFTQNQVLFLGFVVLPKKFLLIKAIKEWPEPKTLTEAYSFHSLVSFCKRFIRIFYTITP